MLFDAPGARSLDQGMLVPSEMIETMCMSVRRSPYHNFAGIPSSDTNEYSTVASLLAHHDADNTHAWMDCAPAAVRTFLQAVLLYLTGPKDSAMSHVRTSIKPP